MVWQWRQQRPGTGADRVVRGFTLIELMIVIMLLGILASIVIAMMGDPTATARQTALAMTLHEFRSQLKVYAIQHQDTLPADGTVLANGLLHQTDAAGNIGTGGQYTFGPYLTDFPRNPYNKRTDVKVVPAGAQLTPDGSTGWLYQVDGTSFVVVANTTGTTPEGKAIASY